MLYADCPCSAKSRPSASSSGVTRTPIIAFTIENTTYAKINAATDTESVPIIWVERLAPPQIPTATVTQIPQTPTTDIASTGTSI